jgi:outer membrane protein
MYKRLINILLLLLITVSTASYAATKIGVVKLDILFKEIPIYKESQTKLKNEFKPKADELKKIETSWNKLNDDYLKNERTMSKDQRKSKIKEINDIEQKFRTNQQALQQELQGKQNSELQRIRIIVEKAINKYAEDNDYDLILRADGTTLFAKKYVDITQDIINILN